MFTSEQDLLATLNFADGLIRDCITGQITFDGFLNKYDSFFMRYALDGHESDANEKALLEKYSARITIHKEIWDEIETKITTNQFASQSKEFINHSDGFKRLKKLGSKYLEIT